MSGRRNEIMVTSNSNNVVPLQGGNTNQNLSLTTPSVESIEYIVTDEGFKMIQHKSNGSKAKMISNFTAYINSMDHYMIESEDGFVENERIKTLQICYLNKVHPGVPLLIEDVSYADLCQNKFPFHRINDGYIVNHGCDGHFCKSLLNNSDNVSHRYIYKNLGWSERFNKPFYVHEGGVIGRDGLDGNLYSEIGEPFSKYNLSLPETDMYLKEAFTFVKDFINVAPENVTYPLLAAVGLAPVNHLVKNRTSLFVVGPRQSMKTTLASLAQSFFGTAFDGKSQMVDFTSTDNSIEVIMNKARNCLLVIDDFNKNNKNSAKVAGVLERLIRSVGNSCAKQRMATNGKLQSSNPPMCVPVITGEELPEGESTIARTLVTNIVSSDVDVNKLSILQEQSKSGIPVVIMHHYIKWIAENMENLPNKLKKVHVYFRDKFNVQANQRRLADNVADFMTGIYCFMLFAREQGIVNTSEFNKHITQAFTALRHSAKRTEIAIDRDNIGKRFLYALNDGIKEKTVALAKIGRQQDSSLPVIGWYDDNSVYLFPQKAHGMVKNHAQSSLCIELDTMIKTWKSLNQYGLLASKKGHGTLTDRKTVNGIRESVIHINRSELPSLK